LQEFIMSLSKIAASALALSCVVAAGVASAQEATPDTWITEAKSVKTREEVRAEVIAARRSGELTEVNAEAYAFAPNRWHAATSTVAQVRR
jgi:Domain of unknown function (DUF4148)